MSHGRFTAGSLRNLCRLLAALAGLTLFPVPAAHATWLFSYPPNMIKLDSGHRNNVFYVGSTVQFTLNLANYGTYALQGAVSYEVRDYWGNVVDQGTAPAPTTTASSTLTAHVTQPGWYKLYLHEPTSVAPWGDSVGATTFVIFRSNPNFPVEPSPSLPNNSAGADGGDEVARGVTGMGPIRHEVQDASNPSAAIPVLQQAIGLDEQYYVPYDPARPRALLIAFPNGVSSSNPTTQAANLAGLRQIVQQFHSQVKYWEPLNEPNNQYNGADYLNKELKPFYQVVKSVDPTCKVLGPAIVTAGPYGLNWLQGFFQAGGAAYIDAFSFHAYNNVNGDPVLVRQSLNGLEALLTQYGIGSIEKWQTEQGYFAACYGAYEPRLQGRWTMLQMMMFEQYGIPKEHNHVWYDVANGYWDFPAFWENADGPYSMGGFNPAAALMRVWSEEISGANFQSAYDFGPVGDKMYLGDLFGGPGKRVAAFMSAGRTDGQITLQVSGGASLHVVSAFGVAQDLPVTNGRVTLPVPELPVYVEPASGQSIQVVPINFGPDLALTPGTTATSSGTAGDPLNPSNPNDISKIINGVLENWYYNQGTGDHPWMDSTPTFPAWVQITLPHPTLINHVIIYAGVPWQADGSLLDYEIQYDNNGQWVTLQHVTEPTNVINFFTPADFTTVDSFYSDRCIFEHDFPAVTTQKIRLLVNNTTYGGGATAAVVQAGGQTGLHQVELREVELYYDGGQTPPAPVGGQTPPASTGGQIRYAPRVTCETRMVGGQFQGSSDGVNYTTLYTVTAPPPDDVWTTVPLSVDPKTFRYLRYLAPNGTYGNIAEMEFDSGTDGAGDAVKITGTSFGTPGSYNNVGNGFTKVFDSNFNTFFDAPAPGNGDFVGIDQGGPATPTPTPTPTPPAAPSGLTATAGSGSIALAWNAVSGAASYNLYRATASGQETLLTTGLSAPAETDAGLTAGTTYYYQVTAVGPGGESAKSNEASATPPAAPPTVVTVAASPASVTGTTTGLSALGADSQGAASLTYTWRGTGPAPVTFSANGTNAAQNTVAAFTAAGAYTFQVTITDALGKSATGSVAVSVLQTPAALVIAPASASVPLGGTQQFSVTGKDQFGAAIAHPATTWSVPGAAGTISARGLFTAGGTGGGPYPVTAASGAANGTAAVVVTPPPPVTTPGVPPAAPSGLRALAGSRQANLHWNAVAGATSYNVYRATTSGKETLLVSGLTAPSDTDSGLTSGDSYYYWVTAVGPGGESARSIEVSTYIN